MNAQTLWLAVALIFLGEGILIGFSPATWKRIMQQMIQLPDQHLRRMGLGMAVTAVIIVALLYRSMQ